MNRKPRMWEYVLYVGSNAATLWQRIPDNRSDGRYVMKLLEYFWRGEKPSLEDCYMVGTTWLFLPKETITYRERWKAVKKEDIPLLKLRYL